MYLGMFNHAETGQQSFESYLTVEDNHFYGVAETQHF